VSKADLKKARADAEFWHYESIAKLIVDNPCISLAELRRIHGITHHDMWKAQAMFHVHGNTGRGSPAYKSSIKQ